MRTVKVRLDDARFVRRGLGSTEIATAILALITFAAWGAGVRACVGTGAEAEAHSVLRSVFHALGMLLAGALFVSYRVVKASGPPVTITIEDAAITIGKQRFAATELRAIRYGHLMRRSELEKARPDTLDAVLEIDPIRGSRTKLVALGTEVGDFDERLATLCLANPELVVAPFFDLGS